MDEQELAPDQFTHNNLQLNAPAGNKLLGQVLPNPLTAQQQLFLITSEQKNFHFNPLVDDYTPTKLEPTLLGQDTDQSYVDLIYPFNDPKTYFENRA